MFGCGQVGVGPQCQALVCSVRRRGFGDGLKLDGQTADVFAPRSVSNGRPSRPDSFVSPLLAY